MDFYEAFGAIAAIFFIGLIVLAVWLLDSQWKEEDEERKKEKDERHFWGRK